MDAGEEIVLASEYGALLKREILHLPTLRWIDIVGPTEEELAQIAAEFCLPLSLVLDCLQPEHLPKYEQIGDTEFIIFRYFDPESDPEGTTIRETTHKIAIFLKAGLTITVHRRPYASLDRIEDRMKNPRTEFPPDPFQITTQIMKAAFSSYEAPLEKAEEQIDQVETNIFSRKPRHPVLEDIHFARLPPRQ